MKNWLYVSLGFFALVGCGIIYFVKGWWELLGFCFFQSFFVWNAYAHQHKKIMIAPPPSQNIPFAENGGDRKFLLMLSIGLSLILDGYCLFSLATKS